MEHKLDCAQIKCLSLKSQALLRAYHDQNISTLTHNQYIVLTYLYAFPNISSTELMQKIGISKQQLSKTYDLLECKNLIKRTYGATRDKRKVEVSLTSEGVKCIEMRYDVITHFLNEHIEKLSLENQECICRAIQILLEE